MDGIISAFIQFALVILVCGVSYYIFSKRRLGFRQYLGLYFPNDVSFVKPAMITLILAMTIMVGPLMFSVYYGFLDSELLITEFSGLGLSPEIIIRILFKAIVMTAISEEILFRGLFAKRLIQWLGFVKGNVLQGIIFGLPHGLPFILILNNIPVGIMLLISASVVGIMQCYINEKYANGSLLPSIIVHGTMNVMSFVAQAMS